MSHISDIIWYLSFSKKLKIDVPFDPATPLLDIYRKKSIIRTDTCTSEFTAALFTTMKTWKHPKCPLTDEWIKKMWYIYNGILLSHKKELNNSICSNMDVSRDYHTKWSKSERERQISYDITYMWNLKKWYKWTYLPNRNRFTDVERGKVGGKDKLGGWD